ncbi:18074_t:CDS:2, partial [Dentiscutata erythropus]
MTIWLFKEVDSLALVSARLDGLTRDLKYNSTEAKKLRLENRK